MFIFLVAAAVRLKTRLSTDFLVFFAIFVLLSARFIGLLRLSCLLRIVPSILLYYRGLYLFGKYFFCEQLGI